MSTISIDVMAEGRYVCTLRYPYHPVLRVRPQDIEDFVLSQRPSLRHRKGLELCIDNNDERYERNN